MSPIEITPVRTKAEQKQFLTFPWQIYRHDLLWVPPIMADHAARMDPQNGVFLKRGEGGFFIARQDGAIVGTICAAVDRPANESRRVAVCVFGFFNCIDDYQVAEALFNRVRRWALDHRLDALLGPFNLDYEDAYGVLLEGRDRPPAMLCGHTPPYYQGFFERYGFLPARGDNLAFELLIKEETPAMQQLGQLADRVRKRGTVQVRSADMENWLEETRRVHALINKALAHLPGHIDWQLETLQELFEPFRKLADPDLVLFAESGGQAVGFLPGLPDINQWLIHANGLRYPWNYASLWLHSRKKPDCLAVKSVLVLPEFWGLGAGILLFDELVRRARQRGYVWMDLSLTSADNPRTPGLAARMGAKVYKRYRVYQMAL